MIINNVEVTDEAFAELALKQGFIRKEPEQVGRFVPEIGEVYWFTRGEVSDEYNRDHEYDRMRIALGNCYRTKEEAEAARDKQLATVRVLDRLAELSVGFDVVDWNTFGQQKYVPYYDFGSYMFKKQVWSSTQGLPAEYYTTNPDAWPTIIKELSGDLKLMMGVE